MRHGMGDVRVERHVESRRPIMEIPIMDRPKMVSLSVCIRQDSRGEEIAEIGRVDFGSSSLPDPVLAKSQESYVLATSASAASRFGVDYTPERRAMDSEQTGGL